MEKNSTWFSQQFTVFISPIFRIIIIIIVVIIAIIIRIKIDSVKHLVIKTIKKNWAQRFDDSMSSFSSEK